MFSSDAFQMRRLYFNCYIFRLPINLNIRLIFTIEDVLIYEELKFSFLAYDVSMMSFSNIISVLHSEALLPMKREWIHSHIIVENFLAFFYLITWTI